MVATIATELPELKSTYRLSPDTCARYRRDGHVLLREVCTSDEVEAYRGPIVDAAARHNREKRPLNERDTFGKAFLQTLNLWRKDEDVARFSLAKRFARIAAELMGVDA